MSNLNKLADQIATDCAEMQKRPKAGTIYLVELTSQERDALIEALKAREEEYLDNTREALDNADGSGWAFSYHQTANEAAALADKFREAEPVSKVKGVSIGTAHVGIDFPSPAPTTVHVPIPGTMNIQLSPEELRNLNEDPREKQLNKVREIVERLDEALAFQVRECKFNTLVFGPTAGVTVDLTEVMDELTEALNADRG